MLYGLVVVPLPLDNKNFSQAARLVKPASVDLVVDLVAWLAFFAKCGLLDNLLIVGNSFGCGQFGYVYLLLGRARSSSCLSE